LRERLPEQIIHFELDFSFSCFNSSELLVRFFFIKDAIENSFDFFSLSIDNIRVNLTRSKASSQESEALYSFSFAATFLVISDEQLFGHFPR
jgi:hypothetical protein